MAISDLRNQHWPSRGLRTRFTMINGAMETGDTALEPAGLPSGASQALKVGGGTLSDQNKSSLALGAVVGWGRCRCPSGISSLAPPRPARPKAAQPHSQGPGK